MIANGAHLVGSVPLPDADAVFRAVAASLGGHLARLPDGETGVRKDWIAWQYAVLVATPGRLLDLFFSIHRSSSSWRRRLWVPSPIDAQPRAALGATPRAGPCIRKGRPTWQTRYRKLRRWAPAPSEPPRSRR